VLRPDSYAALWGRTSSCGGSPSRLPKLSQNQTKRLKDPPQVKGPAQHFRRSRRHANA